jgi:hypothetical protein
VKAWKIILISTLITLTIGGIYLYSVWRQRQNPGVIGQQAANDTLSKDDLAVIRAFFPQHYEDLQRLEGTTVWMKDGYVIPYFPYVGGRVEFAKKVGVIPANQQMDVKKIIKSAVPASVDDGMSHGSRQAFVVFALPGGKELFATPVGTMQGSEEVYFSDMLYFYDDPHKIYDYWPKDVWAAIDAHQVKQGMSELETRMAIGQNAQVDGQKEGDRTVTYDQDGKQWTVTYVDNRATKIVTAVNGS